MTSKDKTIAELENANKLILKLFSIPFNENDKVHMRWYSERGHAGNTLIQLYDNYKTLCTLPSKDYYRINRIAKILQ